eukprot:COSAG01_NODE_7083_length_3361_cov_1.957388_6_plen_219_part_00
MVQSSSGTRWVACGMDCGAGHLTRPDPRGRDNRGPCGSCCSHPTARHRHGGCRCQPGGQVRVFIQWQQRHAVGGSGREPQLFFLCSGSVCVVLLCDGGCDGVAVCFRSLSDSPAAGMCAQLLDNKHRHAGRVHTEVLVSARRPSRHRAGGARRQQQPTLQLLLQLAQLHGLLVRVVGQGKRLAVRAARWRGIICELFFLAGWRRRCCHLLLPARHWCV